MHRVKPLLLTGVWMLLCGLLAQRQGQSQNATPSTYLLGPDDQIVVHVSDAPDIGDKPVRIDSNGEIKIPMAGRIQASGMSTAQLEAQLAKRLKVYIENPEVSVNVAELRSQPVSVIGAVNSPGLHQLEGHKTLIEILSLAGGLRTDAGSVAKITRHLDWGRIPLPGAADDSTGQFSLAQISLKSLIEAKHPEQNIPIFPQDVISVPPAQVVYVMGEVSKTGPLTMTEGDRISVLEALSSSGGALHTASPAKAKILRATPGGERRTEIAVDIKKIQDGKADDVPLLAGDILFVPGSSAKRASIRAAEAAIQVGAIAAGYGIVR